LGLPAEVAEGKDWDLRSLLRKPHFIPQTKNASDLFREFRFNRVHLAIVVDEYGGVAGLVTMEDLLEELFGEIQDEYDAEEPQPRELDENTIIIPARMPIEEFNLRVGAELPEEEYDTMGGLVFGLFGRLPTPKAKVSYMLYTFTVEKMAGTSIQELKIEWQPEAVARPEAEEAASGPPTEDGSAD
jgi:CBS domain containing-hemolysin-like protein